MTDVEKIARIIDPVAWNWHDGVVRPFAEGRGSRYGDQQEFYGMAYRAGVRTADEAHEWCLHKSNAVIGVMLQQSIETAIAILAALVAKVAQDGKDSP
jgi:hypothetical protein